MVNVAPKREEMREHLMSAHRHIAQAQSLYEEFEQSLEVIESHARHFGTTRRIARRTTPTRGR
jgi:hypothetical protein